jgi:hypothetical protein
MCVRSRSVLTFAGASRMRALFAFARSGPAAPHCDVTASQSDAFEAGRSLPGFFFERIESLIRNLKVNVAAGLQYGPVQNQSPAVSNRNSFTSSFSETNPSGRLPRLYSAMRFFHLRKSVMLSGSIRISTRLKLASSRFISF